MNSDSPLLAAASLSCGWGSRAILSDASLELKPGEITALIGKNGAGKSTLLMTLAGLIPALNGEVLVGGRPVASLSARLRAQQIGLVPQKEAAAFDYTLEQIVLMGRIAWSQGLHETPDDRQAAENALAALGLTDLKDKPISQVSGGQAQLATIARCLAQNPQVLLLDEPTAHLDYQHHALLAEQLRAFAAAGRAVFFAAHDIAWALRVSDRVICLKDGAILWAGTKEESLPPIEQALSTPLQPVTLPDGALSAVPRI